MNLQRRELFQTLFTFREKNEQEDKLVRLPYNQDTSLFEKKCIECELKQCGSVCETDIIKFLDDGSPWLDFSKKGCTYCQECAKSCDAGVLDLKFDSSLIRADITLNISKCLAWQNVICTTCADVCHDKAIKFLGMLRPEIIYENCTNCGYCIGVCPSNSISAKAVV